VDQIKETKSGLAAEIKELIGERDKLKADVAKLKKDTDRRYHEVAAIVPESEGQARTILEAAQAMAAELVKEAEDRARKREAEADAYSKRIMSAAD
jgi:cell division septum initiation protein DivIVA